MVSAMRPLTRFLVALAAIGVPAVTAAQTVDPMRGFREIDTGRGVALYQRGRDYLEVIVPRRGGEMRSLLGPIIPSFEPFEQFPRKTIDAWWDDWNEQSSGAFSVLNGQFFDMTSSDRAPLAFSVKSAGVVHTGYGDATEYKGAKRMLVMGESKHDILPYDDDAGTLRQRPEEEIIVGLKPDAAKTASRRVGRTFIGVTPNGRTLLFTSPGATQRYATRILFALGAGRQSVMMLDGGGSTQLVQDGKRLLPRNDELRTIPHVIGVSSGTPSRLR